MPTVFGPTRRMPLRPVAVTLGKSVNNGWGAFECCWARTVLATLVGALEVPGGTLGTTVRLNRPHDDRHLSVAAGEDGFMAQKFNPTDKAHWVAQPTGRNAHRTLVPIVGNSAWSQALGPTQLAWMFQREVPRDFNMPKPTLPDIWFIYRSNPAISFRYRWSSSSRNGSQAALMSAKSSTQPESSPTGPVTWTTTRNE